MKSVFACLLLVVVVARETPIPAFLWSGNEGILKHGSQESPDSVSQSSLSDLVKMLVENKNNVPEELAPHLNDNQSPPELVLLFVHPKLNTAEVSALSTAYTRASDGGALRHLKSSVDASPSLSLPYTYKTADSSLLQLLEQGDRVHVVDAEDAPAFLHGHQWMYSDHKTDVVVVRFASNNNEDVNERTQQFRKQDELLGQIVTKADTETSGNYIGVFTANGASTLSMNKAASLASEQMYIQTKSTAQNKEEEDASEYQEESSSDTLKMTPGGLSGILVGLLLFSVSSIGVLGLMNLETPDSFEGEGGYLVGRSAN